MPSCKYVIVICVLLLAFNDRFLAGSDVDQTIRKVQFPSSPGIGQYVPLKKGEPKRLTVKEENAIIAKGVPDAAFNRRRPLSGLVEYTSTYGVSIAIQSDTQGDVNAKLKSLSRLPSEDVRALVCIGQLNADGMKVLSRFTKLQDLMLEASPVLETKEGASLLSQLDVLQYIEIVPSDDRKFGSQSFCKACLTLEQLRYLALPCEKLTDNDVKALAQHNSLERLYLRSTKPVLGRTSLQALNRMNNLRELEVVCTAEITDADIMGFAEIDSLEFLSVGTQATINCRERFQARKPHCKVYFVDLSDDLP